MSTHLKQDSNPTKPKPIKKHIYQYLWFQLFFGVTFLLCAIIIFLKQRYSPEKCVNEFLNALNTKNYQTIKDFMTCNELEITEDAIKPFIELYHADRQFGSDIKNTLNQDLANVDLDTYNDKHWIKLVSHRKFLIQTYTILIQPVHVTLKSNLHPVTISYANDSQILDEANPTLFATLLPGLYQFDADYYDFALDKTYRVDHSYRILSDLTVDMNFDCSRLVINLSNDYQIDSIQANGINLLNLFTKNENVLSYYPIFQEELITLTCSNTWGQTVSTAFMIPEQYNNQTYEYQCDFSRTSKEFQFGTGLSVTNLSINGNDVANLPELVDEEKGSILLNDLGDQSIIVTTLLAPWGETFIDTYEVTKENFDEYYHVIDCYLSERTKSQILLCAKEYYMALFDWLNHDNYDLLKKRADMDEVAYDFYIMLENIQYDYDNHPEDINPFEEDIMIEPVELYADKNQLMLYSDPIILNLIGFANTTTTSTKEDENTPFVQVTTDDYNVCMHMSYDPISADWQVTANFYDYENTTLVDPIQLDLQ